MNRNAFSSFFHGDKINHMNVIISKPKSSEEGKVSFPALQSWNPSTEIATIAAQVSGKRVLCRIPMTDLSKKFDFSTEEPMKAVTKYRAEIEAAARKLIDNKTYEEDGSINIFYKDF
jgi:hypothetical protein